MNNGELVEALERLVELLQRQQEAIRDLDAEAAIATAAEIDAVNQLARQHLGTPPTPDELALASIIRRLNRSNGWQLAVAMEPLYDLIRLAEEQDAALMLDHHA